MNIVSILGFMRGYLEKSAAFGDKLEGGLADDSKPQDFDKEELAEGVETELEHTDDIVKAMEIAMDHLKEHDGYYAQLEAMEDAMEGPEKPEKPEEKDAEKEYSEAVDSVKKAEQAED